MRGSEKEAPKRYHWRKHHQPVDSWMWRATHLLQRKEEIRSTKTHIIPLPLVCPAFVAALSVVASLAPHIGKWGFLWGNCKCPKSSPPWPGLVLLLTVGQRAKSQRLSHPTFHFIFPPLSSLPSLHQLQVHQLLISHRGRRECNNCELRKNNQRPSSSSLSKFTFHPRLKVKAPLNQVSHCQPGQIYLTKSNS